MKLDFLDLGKLSISPANMRYAKKAPDVCDILPTIRKRGIIVPILVRPAGSPASSPPTAYEIVAGARRYTAAMILAGERRAAGQEVDPMPCAILDESDDADAIEASLIENIARLDPDEVTRWETFARLVKEGREAVDIAKTFGLPELAVRRILALGNLLPRIRSLYRDGAIDSGTIRHLTMATKSQQRAWLALFDAPDAYAPTGHQLKAWLLGGHAIAVKHALFATEGMAGIIADLFGEDRYFAEPQAFWDAQNAAIAARRKAYLDAGWSDAVIVPPAEHFHAWEYAKAPKRKGGRVYIDVRANGEVAFHEGYVTAKEARRSEGGEVLAAGHKVPRPEVTGAMQTYIDLHRHAAVRAALVGRGAIALRLMVAHAIAGSPLWTVRPEPQTTRHEATRESVEICRGETEFDEKRRAVLAMLGILPEEPTVIGSSGEHAGLTGVFLRLLALDEAQLLDVIAIVMGESLAAGSAAVEAVGQEIGVDMAAYWQADDAFFDLIRDREILSHILADVAGQPIASANAGEKGKTLKAIIRNYLAGSDGRAKVAGWVPGWMAFPPVAYTGRGGVGTVSKAELVAIARSSASAEARLAPAPGGPDASLSAIALAA